MAELSAEALAIHQSALIIDGHADTPQRFLDDGWSFCDPLLGGHLNLESARAGNLAAEFFALWVDPAEHPQGTHAARALALGHAVLQQIRLHPDQLQLCLTPDDIVEAHAAGRFGVLLSVEGGHAIENSLEKLAEFYALGVRSMTLTWNNANDWADSSAEPPRHTGLTDFGREVIATMNRLGMIADISHASDRTFWDTLKASSAPIVATHSCAHALNASHRNLTDDQLRGLAANGGVCMVNFYPAFLDDGYRQAWNLLEAERTRLQAEIELPFRAAGMPVPFSVSGRADRQSAEKMEPVPLARLIDHFEHIIRVAGIDHVGLGSDFDGISSLPAGLESAADLPRITHALHERGYSREDLHKLLGGNLLRVFRTVQACAGTPTNA